MKILIAPNAFKGTITSGDVANAINDGIIQAIPGADNILIPVSDGGDGSLATFSEIFNGSIRSSVVSDPLGGPVEAHWCIMHAGQAAFIETALAFGLSLVPMSKRNPYITTSRGVGDLINAGLDLGLNDFIIGVGGSANNDGGSGMLRSLGARFLDKNGMDLGEGGYELRRLEKIILDDINPKILDANILMLSDSSVPLVGETGVSIMYSQGKGATSEMAKNLDTSLRRYADVVYECTNVDISTKASTGAGGGITYAGEVFLGAEIQYGIDVVLDKLNFESQLSGVDLVIVGEGQLDEQTIYNKAPIGVSKLAKKYNIPVLSVSATLGNGFENAYEHGINLVVNLSGKNKWFECGTIINEKMISDVLKQVFIQISSGKIDLYACREITPDILT